MTAWNPKQYLRFGDERIRPALDLLTRVLLKAPQVIYNFGLRDRPCNRDAQGTLA